MKDRWTLAEIVQEHFPSVSMDIYELLQKLEVEYEQILVKLSDPKEVRVVEKRIRTLRREKARYFRSMTQASFLEGVERFRIDPEQPHFLYEEFTYARPYQYKFDGRVHKVKSFRALYVRLLKTLHRMDRNRLLEVCFKPSMQLPSSDQFNETGDRMRVPREVAKGFYCETGLKANAFRDNISKIFRELEIDGARLEVYFDKMRLPNG